MMRTATGRGPSQGLTSDLPHQLHHHQRHQRDQQQPTSSSTSGTTTPTRRPRSTAACIQSHRRPRARRCALRIVEGRALLRQQGAGPGLRPDAVLLPAQLRDPVDRRLLEHGYGNCDLRPLPVDHEHRGRASRTAAKPNRCTTARVRWATHKTTTTTSVVQQEQVVTTITGSP